MIKSIVFPSLKNALITLLFVGILFFNSVNSAWAKRPPEIRNQQDLNLEPDMHGQDLSGNEYVKFDLNGFNFQLEKMLKLNRTFQARLFKFKF